MHHFNLLATKDTHARKLTFPIIATSPVTTAIPTSRFETKILPLAPSDPEEAELILLTQVHKAHAEELAFLVQEEVRILYRKDFLLERIQDLTKKRHAIQRRRITVKQTFTPWTPKSSISRENKLLSLVASLFGEAKAKRVKLAGTFATKGDSL